MSNNKQTSPTNSIKTTPPIPNKEWNEISSWLQELNYSNYSKLFMDGGYDLWEIIYDLSIDDLKSLGILPGHAKRIYHKLKLKKEKISKNSNISSTNEKQNVISMVSNVTNVSHIPPSIPTVPTQQQLQQLAIEERRRKLRERFQSNALFAGGIKNKLFETMTRVLNGLQQELIQYNGKFAEPINEMNQRIVALQKLDIHNLDGIWDSNDGLFEPMMRNIRDIQTFNNDMWNKINEFHNLADIQIKQSITQLERQINLINQMKTQYLINIQKQKGLQRQIPLNKIVTNNINHSPKVSNVNISNINQCNNLRGNQFNSYQFIQQTLPKIGVINNGNKNNNSIKHKKKKHYNDKNNTTTTTTNGRKPAYVQGELEMMKNYDKKKQTVADIIELQRKMQSIYGIPRSAYGIAQKMYRMGVLSATLPKKLQALQDKPDADKIKIGDGIMNIRKKIKNDKSVSISDSYYSSNDNESTDSSEGSESDSDNENIINNKNKKPKTQLKHLYNFDYMTSDSSNTIPQRKPPSTNLRRYTADEVHYIRQLIDEYPKEEAKVLFVKFRKKFQSWKDDTEAYTKFYQKKWRLNKEKQNQMNNKRKRQINNNIMYVPPHKKIKIVSHKSHSRSHSKSQSPKGLVPKKEVEISFDENIMQKLPPITTNIMNNSVLPPPLPPPPLTNGNTNKK